MLITPIQVRFADTDALGHVNNAAFASWVELGRLELVGKTRGGVGPRGVGSLILAHLAIDFRLQVHLGQHVELETWVQRIGRSSIELGQRVVADGRTAADIASVVVWYDYAAQRSAPVPDGVRASLLAEGAPGVGGPGGAGAPGVGGPEDNCP